MYINGAGRVSGVVNTLLMGRMGCILMGRVGWPWCGEDRVGVYGGHCVERTGWVCRVDMVWRGPGGCVGCTNSGSVY